MFLKIFFISLPLFAQINAANYYVDSEKGANVNSGLTPEFAWKTLSKVMETSLQPGDSVLLKRGSKFPEEFILSFSGTKDNPIVIGAYGKGEKPLIKGSIEAKKWRKHSNIVWRSKLKEEPACIWLIDEDKTIHWGIKKESINALEKNYDFVWQDSVLYLFLGKNPSKTFPKVECSVRDYGIINNLDLKNIDYLIIENLEISFVRDAAIRAIGSKGWIVKNCTLHHNGVTDESDGQGIQYEGTDGLFSNNVLYENGQHGFFLSSFGNADVAYNIIEKNKIYNNYHTGIDLMNDGGDENSHSNTIIRQNLVYETPNFKGVEVGIQTLGYENGLVKNVTIHHNIVVNISDIGISAVSNSDSIFIHNNTVYETKNTCINIDNDTYYAEVYNNIGISHIYWAPFFVENSKNKNVDYNIWNIGQQSFAYIDGEYADAWNDYVKKYGFDKNGTDKQLNIHLENLIPVITESDAFSIDNGKNLKYNFDYFGKPIRGNLDIGAIEF